MFQIVVAVIAVAVVALLAIATVFYGGGVFMSSGERGRFDGYVQQGTQIQASMKLYNVDTGGTPTGSSSSQFSTLTNNSYLASVPQGGWIIDNQVIYKPLTDNGQCSRFNAYAGANMSDTTTTDTSGKYLADYEGCPPCDDATWSKYPACQSSTVSSNETTTNGN